MTGRTANYLLTKPQRIDLPDITQLDGNWDIIDAALQAHADQLGTTPKGFTYPTIRTSPYTAAAWEFVRCNPTAGTVPITLPSGVSGGSIVAVKREIVGGTNAVTVAPPSGSTLAGSTASVSVVLDGEVLWFGKDSGTNWTIIAGQKSLSSLDARYVLGPVVDASVSSSAAIAQSKIANLVSDLAARALLTEPVNTVATAGATQTIPSPTTYSQNKYTLSAASCTFTMPTAVAGQSFGLTAVQDGTGGRLAVFTGAKWAGGSPPTLSTGAGKIDDLVFACTDTAVGWKGYVAGLDMR